MRAQVVARVTLVAGEVLMTDHPPNFWNRGYIKLIYK